MKTFFIVLILFTSIICGDYRMPNKSERKCLVKKLGEKDTQKLLASLRKYHRANGKATLYDYILDKRPDLKEVSNQCLLKIKKRRLDGTKDEKNETITNSLFKYYLNSILRDEKIKNAMIQGLKKNNNEAIKVCLQILPNKAICKTVIYYLIQQLKKK